MPAYLLRLRRLVGLGAKGLSLGGIPAARGALVGSNQNQKPRKVVEPETSQPTRFVGGSEMPVAAKTLLPVQKNAAISLILNGPTNIAGYETFFAGLARLSSESQAHHH